MTVKLLWEEEPNVDRDRVLSHVKEMYCDVCKFHYNETGANECFSCVSRSHFVPHFKVRFYNLGMSVDEQLNIIWSELFILQDEIRRLKNHE